MAENYQKSRSQERNAANPSRTCSFDSYCVILLKWKDIWRSYDQLKSIWSTARIRKAAVLFPCARAEKQWNMTHLFSLFLSCLRKTTEQWQLGIFFKKYLILYGSKVKEAEIFWKTSKMMGTKYHNYFQGFLAKVGFASGFLLCM